MNHFKRASLHTSKSMTYDHANNLKIEMLESQGISEIDLPLQPRSDKITMDRILNSNNIFINSTLN